MGHINISDIDLVRAWKDEEYRNSLTEAQRSQLPDNPAGLMDLSDEDITSVRGGIEIPGFDVPTVNDGTICPTQGFTKPDPYPHKPTPTPTPRPTSRPTPSPTPSR